VKLRFFGDSVCNGQYVSVNKTFPCLIANEHPDWTVTVSARNGETTREALARITHDVIKDPPDMLYVQYGINDANKWSDGLGISRTSQLAFKANIKEIITRAKTAGIGRIMLGTNHPILKAYPADVLSTKTFEQMNELYNEAITVIGVNVGAVVIDHHSAWASSDCTGRLMSDGVHLTEAGHMAYYQKIKEYL
jgi:lysophospholipase L1-like esterase